MEETNSPASAASWTSSDTWQEINSACDGMSSTIGQTTGAIYGYGTDVVTGNPAIGYGVGELVGAFVTENWGHVCDLPAAIFGGSDSRSDK